MKLAFLLSPCIAAFLAVPLMAHAGSALKLNDGWQIASACKVAETGEALSSESYTPQGWLSTSIPSTVVTAQIKAGELPDPYFGTNLRSYPGVDYPIGHIFSSLPMPKDSPYACGWWYRKSFVTPAQPAADGHFWLHFGGINYRAEIWLNGHQIATSEQVAGAYRTYDFDVTPYVKSGKTNTLAVETFAPTEKQLGINWVDWNPTPPDKDMGLWNGVELESTGPVSLRSPMAVTHFTDDTLTTAELTVYAELHNATDHTVKGVLAGSASGAVFEQPVELAAHEDRTVAFTPQQYAALRIRNPKLWWPYQMGDPHLERLTLRFTVNNALSDERSTEFGMREVSSELTSNGSRLFRINGKPILIRGAGWSPDMLLRQDSARLANQFRLVREMHLNTIRLEGKLESDEFFRLADKEGILIMAGWCCCDYWEQWKDWSPDTLPIATASLRSQMLRLRAHPSVFVWLNGSDNPPTAPVESAYLKVEGETHWPNPTLSSASSTPTTVTGASGVKMMGPYEYVAPSYWYVDKKNGGAFGFSPEISPGPAIEPLASRKRFLPDPEAWPPSANWNYHNGGGGFTTLKVITDAMSAIYAKPNSAADFERIGQTMAYDSERAMFEAYSRNKYDSTGVIQWMLNNAWPSMIWHLFDYYLEPGAGYFATRKACEPVHIQYSYDDGSIVVVNSTYRTQSKLKATLSVHNIDWQELYHAEGAVNAAPDSSQRIFAIPENLFEGADRIFFIDLRLTDEKGTELSRNFYWVPDVLTNFDFAATDYRYTPAQRHEDLSQLAHLPPAEVTAHATSSKNGKTRSIALALENRSRTLAFQLSAALRTSSGDLVAPAFWSDNWIELIPGEKRTLTVELPEDAPAEPVIELSGWNVAAQKLTPEQAPAAPAHPAASAAE